MARTARFVPAAVARVCALAAAALVCAPAAPAPAEFRLKGQLAPPMRAVVTLDGFSTTYTAAALTTDQGQFEFKSVLAGTYTLIIAVPNRGEIRRTLELGPASADAKGQIALTIQLDERLFEPQPHAGTIPLRELAIPQAARKAWEEADRELARRNQERAIAKLNEVVRLAPQWSAAWNNLGTLYYKSGRYPDAEHAFRSAVEADGASFEARVNLGGVLLTLHRPDEAYVYNLYCVLERPTDALANSQLGMNDFALGRLQLAWRYLDIARHIDPAHFSHPQLLLAEIDLRLNDRRAAIAELEEFLRYHPDSPADGQVRQWLARIREELGSML
jgi:tetratricopeptide (TPR) repeat protein